MESHSQVLNSKKIGRCGGAKGVWKEVGDATGADMGMQMIVGQGMVDWFSIHDTEEGMEWHSTSSKRKQSVNEPDGTTI